MRLAWLPARPDIARPARMSSALVLATLGAMLTDAEATRSRAAGPELALVEARLAALREARDRLSALATTAGGDRAADTGRR